MKTEWFIIANPTSSSGKTRKLISIVKQLLEKQKIKYFLSLTSFSGEEIQLVDKAIASGHKAILCIGGDGTAQKVVAGIQLQKHLSPKEILFSLIPAGTGNDWARSNNIPMSIIECIKAIKKRKARFIDVGVAKITKEKKTKTRFFLGYSGVGFDVFMLKKIQPYKKFGPLSYLVCAIMNFYKFQNIEIEIITPNNKTQRKVFLVGVGICKYTGGGMRLIHSPKSDDGLLNITIAQDFSKKDIARNFFKLFNGKIFNERKVLTLKANKLTIHAKNKPICCQGDGEIFGGGKIEYSVRKKALQFIY